MGFLELGGKTAIVTGGGSNIGRGVLLALAREGVNVVNAEIVEVQGASAVAEANALGGGKAVFIRTDVTDWDSVQAMTRNTLENFGRIDILVNNVGWVKDDWFLNKSREEWAREIDRSMWGDINCLRAVLPHMVERRYGRIVNMSSDAARVGQVREVVYSGAKGAVLAMTRSLAREVARNGITVNAICPGITVPGSRDVTSPESMWSEHMMKVFGTPDAQEKIAKGIPLGRLGTPEDVANAVLFLASDRASFITGQTLSVDGGYVMV